MGQNELCTLPLPALDNVAGADADLTNHEPGDSSWESVWIDLGGV